MKIIAVIVDEMPVSAKECILNIGWDECEITGASTYRYALDKGMKITYHDYKHTRCPGCPLRLEHDEENNETVCT